MNTSTAASPDVSTHFKIPFMEKIFFLKKYNLLREAYDKYLNSCILANQRRKLWKLEIKEKIFNILTSICESFNLGWKVQRYESVEDLQTINISFGFYKVYLMEILNEYKVEKLSNKKEYNRYQGSLSYSQSYNGKIKVIIGFPFTDDGINSQESHVIGLLEPKAITEEIISDHIVEFLQLLSKWKDAEILT